MTGAVEMVFEPFPGGDLARHMTDNIYSLAFARTGITEFFPMGFFLRSPRGEWLGDVPVTSGVDGCTSAIFG